MDDKLQTPVLRQATRNCFRFVCGGKWAETRIQEIGIFVRYRDITVAMSKKNCWFNDEGGPEDNKQLERGLQTNADSDSIVAIYRNGVQRPVWIALSAPGWGLPQPKNIYRKFLALLQWSEERSRLPPMYGNKAQIPHHSASAIYIRNRALRTTKRLVFVITVVTAHHCVLRKIQSFASKWTTIQANCDACKQDDILHLPPWSLH